ncbi:MAG: 4-hydroxybenzoate octaprenyltransferase [Kordiimonadaceae bacterium]|jgi:4-hydroxybenzoate polyprenyltransferase|nr:4-hydroxybenzoate octaprenyltransferase [Kordiimonadaceae bacterium]MBT6032074.1 4-hydroxybenzoate octaprenyltransferase [Kordiimonadaceae bacterium]
MTKLNKRLKEAPEDTVEQNWVNKLSPDFALGYLQLMRADRPIGTWLLLWPGLWSIALASHAYGHVLFEMHFDLLIIFTIGAFVMRGAGCVVNDLWDREADAQVERTKCRPLPSGRVSVLGALLFLVFLCLIGLFILLQLNRFTQVVGAFSLVFIVIYPLMKRITYWPQLMLGFTFNWGALLGWASVTQTIELPAILLYIGGIFWTLGYDTIYAHQDREDDIIVGVKSTALRFGNKTHQWLSGFYCICFVFFLAAGFYSMMGIAFYLGMLIAAGHLIHQLKKLDINSRDICLELFKSNHHFGIIVFLSIIAGQYI